MVDGLPACVAVAIALKKKKKKKRRNSFCGVGNFFRLLNWGSSGCSVGNIIFCGPRVLIDRLRGYSFGCPVAFSLPAVLAIASAWVSGAHRQRSLPSFLTTGKCFVTDIFPPCLRGYVRRWTRLEKKKRRLRCLGTKTELKGFQLLVRSTRTALVRPVTFWQISGRGQWRFRLLPSGTIANRTLTASTITLPVMNISFLLCQLSQLLYQWIVLNKLDPLADCTEILQWMLCLLMAFIYPTCICWFPLLHWLSVLLLCHKKKVGMLFNIIIIFK